MNPEKTLKMEIGSISDLPRAADDILAIAGSRRIIAFRGELGSGKTTIIKALCSKLGTTETVSSPSFTIINEYRTEGGEPVFHIDLYRLKNISEAIDTGIEDYLSGEHYCFIEWPELIEPLLPDEVVRIKISAVSGEKRNIEFE